VIQPTDPLIVQTTKDLPDEFHFIEDANVGRPIGIGKALKPQVVTKALTCILAWTQFSIANGTRSSAATAYLDPVVDRPNLSVLIGTYVTRVIQTTKGSFKTVEFGQNQTSTLFSSTYYFGRVTGFRSSAAAYSFQRSHFISWRCWHSSNTPELRYW
jgi:hypothetical protein